MSVQITLGGCTPIPLAAFLKALAILRLVGEQVDPEARGFWRNDSFVLDSGLATDELRRFFLEEYKPTPVLAPWNGGSGFFFREALSKVAPNTGKRMRTGRRNQPTEATRTLERLQEASAPRFKTYKQAIEDAKSLLQVLGLDQAPKGAVKDELIKNLRARLSDSSVCTLDAILMLTGEGTRYPPLWGTGGTDGNLDFTSNFIQQLVSLLDPDTGEPRPGAEAFLDGALFGRPAPNLVASAIGQFSPGSAGGANQGNGFSADAVVNPWEFVLMIEGAVLFAAAATRRLETHWPGTLSYPFTVRATGTGSGGTTIGDGRSARAEMWLPLWSRPASLHEVQVLLAEGRATVGSRPARDGLDFVQAVSRLGVDRGIDEFQRYAFLMRAGKAYLATPLNRVQVTRNPNADLTEQLDRNGWLTRYRRLGRAENAPHRVQSLVRRLEDALFDLTLERDYPAPQVQRLLKILGEVQLHLARSPKVRDVCPPVPSLGPDWVARADDNSPEFAVAAALAGLYARVKRADGTTAIRLAMRVHLAPEQDGPIPRWTEEDSRQVTWGYGDLHENLQRILYRRRLAAEGLGTNDKPFEFVRSAPLSAVAAWLGGRLDDTRIGALLKGLTLVRQHSSDFSSSERHYLLPAAYLLLKPFFCTDRQLRRVGLLDPEGTLALPGELISLLASGKVARAARLAQRKLRVIGASIQFARLDAGVSDCRRLLSALLVPVADFELRRLLPHQSKRPLEIETEEEGAMS